MINDGHQTNGSYIEPRGQTVRSRSDGQSDGGFWLVRGWDMFHTCWIFHRRWSRSWRVEDPASSVAWSTPHPEHGHGHEHKWNNSSKSSKGVQKKILGGALGIISGDNYGNNPRKLVIPLTLTMVIYTLTTATAPQNMIEETPASAIARVIHNTFQYIIVAYFPALLVP